VGVVIAERPSRVKDRVWLEVRREVCDLPADVGRGGQWLVYLTPGQVDAAWSRIAAATVEGRLGTTARVSTARPNPKVGGADTRVICVRTYDAGDEADVMRVREALRMLGAVRPIAYTVGVVESRYWVNGRPSGARYFV